MIENSVYEKLKTTRIGMTASHLSKSLGMPLVDVRDHLAKLVDEGKISVDWDTGSGIPYYKVYRRPVVSPDVPKATIRVKPSRLTEFLTTLQRNIQTDLQANPSNLELIKVEKRLSHFIHKYTTDLDD